MKTSGLLLAAIVVALPIAATLSQDQAVKRDGPLDVSAAACRSWS
jgi:hypothetical protein